MTGVERVDFWNHDLEFKRDAKILGGWILAFAVIIPLLQKLLLWPAARYFLRGERIAATMNAPYPKDTVQQGIRNRFQRSEGRADSIQRSDAATKLRSALLSREYLIQWKFVVAATKMLSYVFFLAFSVWALQGQWHWFWDPTVWHLGGKITAPYRLKLLYFMETAYYIYTLFALFWEPKMKDRAQMVFHHLFTITLLTTSYCWNQYRYGTPIMVLHDFSDPWMEAAKLFNYLKVGWGANICFTVFALSFFYLRDYVFPRRVISSTFMYARPAGAPYYWCTFISLVGLWVLHLIWSTMICRVFYENVIVKSGKGDVREEDD